MSRATVRQAVYDFFSSPPVDGLTTIHRSPPRIVGGGEFFGPGSDSGAVGLVHIADQEERRIAIDGAHGGVKERDYTVWVFVLFRSKESDFDQATSDLDALLDNLVDRLQSDRTLGGQVFQAGEGREGTGTDIEISTNLPRRVGDMYHTWTGLKFDVVEMLET